MPRRKRREMAVRDVLGRLDPSREICGTAVVVKLDDDPPMMFVRRHQGRDQRIDVEKPRSWEVRKQFADLSGSQWRRAGACLEHGETSFTVEPQHWRPWRLADRCQDDAISLQRHLEGRFQHAFGDEGGLGSGVPGTPGPNKLWGLAGAGLDAADNLYVGCCLHPAGGGTAVKAFAPDGKPLWDLQCHAFTDGYSFDPAEDGTEVVGVDELISLDLSMPAGQEWSLKALTLDPQRFPDDPRVKPDGRRGNCSAMLRTVGGRRLLYTIGQTSGGFSLFAFEDGPGHVAHAVGRIEQRSTWAWHVDLKGDIWLGDPGDGTVKRYRFLKWEGDKPLFGAEAPDSWPAPTGFDKIQRVHYDTASDTLYVAGFASGMRDPAWGSVGAVLERYDGWTTGSPVKRWRVDLPVDDTKVYPKAMDIAGDYAFVVAVKPVGGQTGMVYVYNLADGTPAGKIWPGREVGGYSGWVDITHALSAFKRADGEYLMLVEEDFRGKCILYRWRP